MTDALLLALGAEARKTERRAQIHAELGYRLRAHSTRRSGARLRRLMVSQALAAAERRKLQPEPGREDLWEPRKGDLWESFVVESLPPDAVGAQLELELHPTAPHGDHWGQLEPGLPTDAGRDTPRDVSLEGDLQEPEDGGSTIATVDELGELSVEASDAPPLDGAGQRLVDAGDVALPVQEHPEFEPATVVNTLLLDRISAYSRREPLAKLGARS